MRVAICGGSLQGVELAWLAHRAGWETLLVDRQPRPPALHLADSFVQLDLTTLPADGRMDVGVCAEKTTTNSDSKSKGLALLASVDLVFPALENAAALTALDRWCTRRGLPFAFDAAAYAVSRSKLRSRDLFLAVGTPIPQPCEVPTFPMIAKPSNGSGSRGVRLFHAEDELMTCFPAGLDTPDMLFEAYCPGPSYSVEVCGTPGAYTAYQVTELHMDEDFDCERVIAPPLPVLFGQSPVPEAAISAEAIRLATALHLRGLMDLEVIVTPEGWRVLEIDARFPSQTPTAVYLSTGINLAEQLARCFLPDTQLLPSPSPASPMIPPRSVLYEHVYYDGKQLRTQGEHIMSSMGPLRRIPNFFGADEALAGGFSDSDSSDVMPERWVATWLFTGATAQEVQARRAGCMDELVVWQERERERERERIGGRPL